MLRPATPRAVVRLKSSIQANRPRFRPQIGDRCRNSVRDLCSGRRSERSSSTKCHVCSAARSRKSSESEKWCGRPDSNRHSSFEPRDFLTSYGFRRLALARSRCRLVCGLDYTFTVARSRFRCCPSSLYTFAPVVRPVRLARDCLLPVSPNLSSSAPRVSRRALKLLKSLASTNFATPALSTKSGT